MPNIYYLKGQITGQGNINRNDVAKIEVLLSQAGVFLSKPTGQWAIMGFA
jgi:hypothetical protein